MIKFFRKIRRNLLSKGKTGKYFKYAIGEIILVVIGILIALSLNNWNENSNRNKLELEALKNLKEDFNYNLSGLVRSDSYNSENIESCLQILNHTGKRYTEEFVLDKYLNDAVSSSDYVAKNGFLNDLINSGNLGLIKNNVLRNLLSSWLSELFDLKEKEDDVGKFNESAIDFIIKNGSFLNVDEMRGFNTKSKSNVKLPESGFEINNNQLLKLPEFENIIENQIILQDIVTYKYKDCIKLNKEILQLLESEIKKKK
jgi:type II secretory pathway pseudopilin PulG